MFVCMSERGAQKNTFGLQKIQEECKTATNRVVGSLR